MLFSGFVFTGSRLVCDTFSELTRQKRTATFNYLLIVLACVHSRFYMVTCTNQLTFKTKSSPYFLLVSEGGPIRFRWFNSCAENLGLLVFSRSFLITAVIHPWLADLHQVLWLSHSEVSRHFHRLCLLFLTVFYSLSPSSEIYLLSLSNSTLHITLQTQFPALFFDVLSSPRSYHCHDITTRMSCDFKK